MYQITNTEEFYSNIKNNNVTLVDFYANWCQPCLRLMPILEGLSLKMLDVNFVKVNVDEFPELASVYSVKSLPTLMLIDRNETILDKRLGGGNMSDIEQWVKRHSRFLSIDTNDL